MEQLHLAVDRDQPGGDEHAHGGSADAPGAVQHSVDAADGGFGAGAASDFGAVSACPADVYPGRDAVGHGRARSEEHTSELQSRENLVCRLLLEKKKNTPAATMTYSE